MSQPSDAGAYGASGYLTPGGAYGAAAYAPPARQYDTSQARVGDRAFEHLTMKRGRFSAWVYVVIAFLLEAALLFCLFGLPVGIGLGALTHNDQALAIATLGVGVPAGLGGAYLVFRDRWRVNEAFSSRFCVGIMNISIMFVPLVSLVYANVRGVQKILGK
jgi:hypothetical protein